MKKLHRALALLGALTLTSAAHAVLPANIQLDGYCNTITNGVTVLPGVSFNSLWYTCVTDQAYTAGGGRGRTTGGMTAFLTIDPAPYGVSYSVVVRDDNTWTLLALDGSLVNSGTWTEITESTPRNNGLRDVLAR